MFTFTPHPMKRKTVKRTLLSIGAMLALAMLRKER